MEGKEGRGSGRGWLTVAVLVFGLMVFIVPLVVYLFFMARVVERALHTLKVRLEEYGYELSWQQVDWRLPAQLIVRGVSFSDSVRRFSAQELFLSVGFRRRASFKPWIRMIGAEQVHYEEHSYSRTIAAQVSTLQLRGITREKEEVMVSVVRMGRWQVTLRTSTDTTPSDTLFTLAFLKGLPAVAVQRIDISAGEVIINGDSHRLWLQAREVSTDSGLVAVGALSLVYQDRDTVVVDSLWVTGSSFAINVGVSTPTLETTVRGQVAFGDTVFTLSQKHRWITQGWVKVAVQVRDSVAFPLWPGVRFRLPWGASMGAWVALVHDSLRFALSGKLAPGDTFGGGGVCVKCMFDDQRSFYGSMRVYALSAGRYLSLQNEVSQDFSSAFAPLFVEAQVEAHAQKTLLIQGRLSGSPFWLAIEGTLTSAGDYPFMVEAEGEALPVPLRGLKRVGRLKARVEGASLFRPLHKLIVQVDAQELHSDMYGAGNVSIRAVVGDTMVHTSVVAVASVFDTVWFVGSGSWGRGSWQVDGKAHVRALRLHQMGIAPTELIVDVPNVWLRVLASQGGVSVEVESPQVKLSNKATRSVVEGVYINAFWHEDSASVHFASSVGNAFVDIRGLPVTTEKLWSALWDTTSSVYFISASVNVDSIPVAAMPLLAPVGELHHLQAILRFGGGQDTLALNVEQLRVADGVLVKGLRVSAHQQEKLALLLGVDELIYGALAATASLSLSVDTFRADLLVDVIVNGRDTLLLGAMIAPLRADSKRLEITHVSLRSPSQQWWVESGGCWFRGWLFCVPELYARSSGGQQLTARYLRDTLEVSVRNWSFEGILRGVDTSFHGGIVDFDLRTLLRGADAEIMVDRLTVKELFYGDSLLPVMEVRGRAFLADTQITGTAVLRVGDNSGTVGVTVLHRDENTLVYLSPVRISLPVVNGFLAGALLIKEGLLQVQVDDTLKLYLLRDTTFFEGTAAITGTRLFIPFTGVEYLINAELHGYAAGFDLGGRATDPYGNKALLKGRVDLSGEPRYSLTASALQFVLLNTTLNQNNLLAGQVVGSAVVRLQGSPSLLDIELARVKPAGRSSLELPIYTGAYVYEADFVDFVERNPAPEKQPTQQSSSLSPSQQQKGGFAVTFWCSAEVDENLTVRVLFDPPQGDVLTVRGTGSQQIFIDPEGYTEITGVFHITSGEYKFNFKNLIIRTFRIEGGDIVWSGDPYSAVLNISAYHETRPYVRRVKEAYGVAHIQGKDYASVWIRMNMSGTLSKPEISFSLESPDAVYDPSLASLLNQINSNEQEKNMQVFALLTTGQLVSPLYVSGGEGGGSSGVYHSVSEFVSQQLNMLASEVLGDPLLEVAVRYQSEKQHDIGGEASMAQRQREFQFALSRSFLQERLRVGIESEVTVGGEKTSSRVPTGTMQVEYALTKDRSLRWRVYSQSYREALFEQNRYKTGMGIRIMKSFDSLRELFPQKVRRLL